MFCIIHKTQVNCHFVHEFREKYLQLVIMEKNKYINNIYYSFKGKIFTIIKT